MVPRTSVRYELALLVGLLAAGLFASACSESDLARTKTPSNVLFLDDFSLGSAVNWQLEQDEFGSTTIDEGKLYITVNQENALQYTTLAGKLFDDFTLEVEVSAIAGTGENSHGILFRMQDPSRFYRFEVTSDGRFMIERSDEDESWTRFLDNWTFSGVIQPGASNLLRIEANGPEMHFYVNDQELHQIYDTQYPSGSIALDAGTFENSTITAAFDNLLIQSR